MKIAVTYATFSILAIMANIGTQELTLWDESSSLNVFISVMAGTGVGLVIKYLLDKRYIFFFYVRNAMHEGRIFTLYTLMGLVTTLIFWGFEFSFYYFFEEKVMRYLGGIIGLTLGYLMKYQLDKRYVFCAREPL